MVTSRLSSEQLRRIAEDGYVVAGTELSSQMALTSRQGAGERNLLDLPVVRGLSGSSVVRGLIEPVLGSGCLAVRGILFNKLNEANWKVAWHQDCVIAVAERKEISGWGPWSIKAGVHHVRPTSGVVSRMLAVRIHLDDCGAENGPLRVIPGSHKHGFLSDRQIQGWPKGGTVTCIAGRGMRSSCDHSCSIVPLRRQFRVAVE
jgi:Phytanoyl-CoA dioxygenase (PhyH)